MSVEMVNELYLLLNEIRHSLKNRIFLCLYSLVLSLVLMNMTGYTITTSIRQPVTSIAKFIDYEKYDFFFTSDW